MKQVGIAHRTWYKTILEMMPEPAIIWRKRGIRWHLGDIVYANKVMRSLSGVDNLSGERIIVQLPREKRWIGTLTSPFKCHANGYFLEICLNDGSTLPISMRSTPIMIENKQCVLSIITVEE